MDICSIINLASYTSIKMITAVNSLHSTFFTVHMVSIERTVKLENYNRVSTEKDIRNFLLVGILVKEMLYVFIREICKFTILINFIHASERSSCLKTVKAAVRPKQKEYSIIFFINTYLLIINNYNVQRLTRFYHEMR